MRKALLSMALSAGLIGTTPLLAEGMCGAGAEGGGMCGGTPTTTEAGQSQGMQSAEGGCPCCAMMEQMAAMMQQAPGGRSMMEGGSGTMMPEMPMQDAPAQDMPMDGAPDAAGPSMQQ